MTLAALRRRLVPGGKLRMIWHMRPDVWRDPEVRAALAPGGPGFVREIVQVRSKDLSLRMPDGRESWLSIPKAGEVQIHDDQEFTVCESGVPYARYRIES